MEKRNCYCSLWDDKPEVLESQGLPKGFCGLCAVCGKPGHTRHFPGASPVTSAWCDRHYRMLALFHPLGHYGMRFWFGLVVVLIVLWKFVPRWLGWPV